MRKNNFKLIVLLLFVLMFVIGCNGQGTDETGDDTDVDTTPPTSLFIYPLSDAWDVDLDTLIRVGFSESMEPATVSAGSFLMMSGSLDKDDPDKLKLPRQPIVGAVGYDETSYIATFTPNADLAPSTIYTVLVTGAITDLAGNRFGFTPWEFITVRLLKVTYTSPYSGETNVARNATIVASFSEPVEPSTVTTTSFTVKVKDTAELVEGTTNVTGDTVTWSPSNPDLLEAYTDYVVTITTDVTDLADNPNHLTANYEWSFTTGDSEDNTDPTISNVNPADGAVDVPINTSIKAEFTEPMNATKLDDTTFIVENVTVPETPTSVSGTVTYTGNTATFIPGTIDQTADLPANSDFEVTIKGSVTDLAGNKLGSDYQWTFNTRLDPNRDVTPPAISLLTPPNGETGVAPNSAITAVFSEPLDATTVNTATFILEDTSGAAPTLVTGTVTYTGTTATFTPNSVLNAGQHTATLTASIADLAGNTMVSNYAWSFDTTQNDDTTAPTVVLTVPVDGATGVATNASISATFSEPMDAATITTTSFILSDGSGDIPGTVTYSGTTAMFTPIGDLAAGNYTATITTDATDLAGNPLNVNGELTNYTWNFITADRDVTAPYVTSTDPTDNEPNIPVNARMIANFNESMDASTLTTATFKLTIGIGGNGFPVAGTVSTSANSTRATFRPSADLAFNTTYTATITTGATDLAGNALLNNYSWPFTTQQGRGGMN